MPPKQRPTPRVRTPKGPSGPRSRPGRGASQLRGKTLAIALAGAAGLAGLAVALSLVFAGGGSKSPAPTPETVKPAVTSFEGIPQHGMVLGNPLARVTLTEYVDTSCPVCREYEIGTFPALTREYVRTGKVKIDARVVAFVGPASPRGRELVLAAGMQNRAFQLLELIYRNQGDETKEWLTDDLARALASRVPGLDVQRLFADASGQAVKEQAARVEAQVVEDGISATPTFVLTTPDGKRHLLGSGSPGPQPFRDALNRALQG